MANDLTKNPWKLDTAAATVLTRMLLKVKSVRWVGATTAGHACILQDQNGRVVWTSVAAGANNVESDLVSEYNDPISWNGLICQTLASGIVYLNLR